MRIAKLTDRILAHLLIIWLVEHDPAAQKRNFNFLANDESGIIGPCGHAMGLNAETIPLRSLMRYLFSANHLGQFGLKLQRLTLDQREWIDRADPPCLPNMQTPQVREWPHRLAEIL